MKAVKPMQIKDRSGIMLVRLVVVDEDAPMRRYYVVNPVWSEVWVPPGYLN